MSEKEDIPTKKDTNKVKEMRRMLKLKEPPVDKELEKLLKDIEEVLKE